MFKIAIQSDPLNTLNYTSDSSYLLALALQEHNVEIFCYEPKYLSLKNNKVIATKGSKVRFNSSLSSPYEEVETDLELDLHKFTAVLIRQDPPFDMNYITGTYLLDMLKSQVFVMNDPSTLRNYPEKLIAHAIFPEYTIPTLISQDINCLGNFQKKLYKEEGASVVLKPLYDFGGRNVKLMETYDHPLLNKYIKEHGTIVMQRFMPAIREGDKRVLIAFGKILGVFKRVPVKGSILANMAQGGIPTASGLSSAEAKTCDIIATKLYNMGIYFAGLDLIDGKIMEINHTSPTGLRYMNDLYSGNAEKLLAEKIIDHIERR
jgi:glutathione synthase